MNTIPPNPKDIPCVAVPKIVVAVLDASPEHNEHTSNIPNLRQGMREPTLVPNILDTGNVETDNENRSEQMNIGKQFALSKCKHDRPVRQYTSDIDDGDYPE